MSNAQSLEQGKSIRYCMHPGISKYNGFILVLIFVKQQLGRGALLLYVGRLNGMVDFLLFLACLTFHALNLCPPLIRRLRTKRLLGVKTS